MPKRNQSRTGDRYVERDSINVELDSDLPEGFDPDELGDDDE